MNAPGHAKVLVAGADGCVRPVEIRRDTIRDVALEAAHRGLSPEALLGKMIDLVAKDDLWTAILGEPY